MALALRIAIALLVVASGARAEGEDPRERVRLDWRRGAGAESCASEAEIGRRVAARLGRDPFQSDAKRTIAARVDRTPEGWRAEIRVLAADATVLATRDPLQSNAKDCSAVSDAVVLAIALAIEPELMLAPPAVPAAPAPTSCPTQICATTSCPACPPPAAPPAPAERDPLRMRSFARGLVALGVLPAPAAGGGLAVELELGPTFSLGAGVLYFPEVQTDDGELGFGLTSFELFGCADVIESEDAALGGCAVFQVGSLHALARGLRPINPGDYLWLATGLGPRGRLSPVRGLVLELGGFATTPLIAHHFVVRGQAQAAHEPATIGFFALLGVGLELP